MTTTTRTLWTIDQDIRATEKALKGSRKLSADTDLRAAFEARYTPERMAELDRDVATYEAKLDAKLTALRAEHSEASKTQCDRCYGTGNYQAPTSRTKGGRPYCFKCGGSGRR